MGQQQSQYPEQYVLLDQRETDLQRFLSEEHLSEDLDTNGISRETRDSQNNHIVNETMEDLPYTSVESEDLIPLCPNNIDENNKTH